MHVSTSPLSGLWVNRNMFLKNNWVQPVKQQNFTVLPSVSWAIHTCCLKIKCVCLVSLHHWLNPSFWRVLHQLSIIPVGTWLVITSLLDLLLRLIAHTLGVKERPLILFSGCSGSCALSPLQCIHVLPQLWIRENWTGSYSAFSLISKCSLSSFIFLFFFFLSILFVASLAWA